MGNLCTNCIDVTNMGKGNCDPTKASNVVYTGPNLPCSGVNTNDNLNTVLSKIEENLCSAPGGQNLQTTLEIGNIAEDIGAKFTSLANPTLYTEILSTYIVSPAFIKIGGLSTQYLMADGSVSDGTSSITQVIADGDTTHAPSADAVYDALLLKADDDNVIHKTLDETKTGQLIVTPVDTSISAIIGNSIDSAGVRGNSDNGPGVFGISTDYFGVFGQGPGGVLGVSPVGTGVSGQSTNGIGVEGLSSVGAAIKGSSTSGIGVVANSVLGSKLASFQANSTEMAYVNSLGDYIGNKFIKIGGLATQYLMADGSITTALTASQIAATPHVDYLTGATVQLQLDQTETSIIGLSAIDKTDFKNLYQTGLARIDLDVSVVTNSPADTLNVTACNNILFINEIAIDTPSNKLANFLKSFGNKSWVMNGTNTLLPVNTRGIFYLGLDKLGSQVYRTSKIYDQDVCYIARVLIQNVAGVYSIISSKYFPDLANNRPTGRDRTVAATGTLVPSGAASISFGNRGLSFLKNSINYSINKQDPNYLQLADSVNPTPMQFLFIVPNITSVSTNLTPITTLVPRDWYLSTGALGAPQIGVNDYQVFKVMLTVTGNVLIQTKASTNNTPQLGVNAIFANIEDATAGLTSTIFPDILPAGDSIPIGTFYLRGNATAALMNDPNYFFYKPITASSSSSTVGATTHDALSGKNDNPTYQHVTTADITNWNAKANDLDVVHKAGTETITGFKTIIPLVNTTGFFLDMPAVNNAPAGGVPDAFLINVRGHNGATTSQVNGVSVIATGNKNIGLGFNGTTGSLTTNSIGADIIFDAASTTNTIIRGRRGSSNIVFSVSDLGDVIANKYTKIGGTALQYLMADGSVSTLTNPISGAGASGQITFWNGTNTITGNTGFTIDSGSFYRTMLIQAPTNPTGLSQLAFQTDQGAGAVGYDTDGAFATSTSTYKIVTGGATRLSVLANGNVGIRTSTPASPFQLVVANTIPYQPTNTSSSVYANFANIHNAGGANNDSSINLVVSGNNTSNNAIARISAIQPIAANNASDMAFGVRTSGGSMLEVIRLTSSGNVGIGTSVPIGKLNINTGSLPTVDIVTQANGTISFCNSTATTNFVPTIAGKSSNGIGLELLSASWDLNPNPDMLFDVREGDNTDFTTLTSPAFKFSRFGVSLVDILRNGFVGIGTTTPTLGKLQVKGTSQMFVLQGSTNGLEAQFMAFHDSDGTRRGYFGFGSNGNDNLVINNDETGGHIVLIATGGGNVGVNVNPTTTTTDKLQVAGNITASAATAANHVVIKSQADGAAYIPTYAVSTNVVSVGGVGNSGIYTVIGNVVTVTINVTIAVTAVSTFSSFTATLPFTMSAGSSGTLGSGCGVSNTEIIPATIQKNSSTTVIVHFKSSSAPNSIALSGTFTYIK